MPASYPVLDRPCQRITEVFRAHGATRYLLQRLLDHITCNRSQQLTSLIGIVMCLEIARVHTGLVLVYRFSACCGGELLLEVGLCEKL